jgi:hypothetical protein
MLSASGNSVVAHRSATVRFALMGVELVHSFYLLDDIPIKEKIILGMDFLVEHEACIDMAASSITFKIPGAGVKDGMRTPSRTYTLETRSAVELQPRQSLCVLLTPVARSIPPTSAGYVSPHATLPDGCLIWHGVYEQRDRHFFVWVTNATDELVTLQARKTVAVWQPDDEGEIRLADGLVESQKGGGRGPAGLVHT